MPEGPEVHIIVDVLSDRLVGKTLVGIQWDSSFRYKNGFPSYKYLEPYFPFITESILCKGKLIIFTFRSLRLNSNGKRFYIANTLGMEGRWSFNNTGSSGKHKHSNCKFMFGNCVECGDIKVFITDLEIYFDDSRHFGTFSTLQTTVELEKKLNTRGPDILTTDISVEDWFQKARNKRIAKKQICDFLLTQKYFSGIGNYLKSEILYRSKIRPNRTMMELTDNELITILYHSLYTIREAYQYGGLTIKSYWDPNGRKGTFPVQVYMQQIDPYGYTVVKNTFKDKRTTHWVPQIQI